MRVAPDDPGCGHADDSGAPCRPEIAAVEAARMVGRQSPERAFADDVMAEGNAHDRPASAIGAEPPTAWDQTPIHGHAIGAKANAIAGDRHHRLQHRLHPARTAPGTENAASARRSEDRDFGRAEADDHAAGELSPERRDPPYPDRQRGRVVDADTSAVGDADRQPKQRRSAAKAYAKPSLRHGRKTRRA